MNELNDWRLQSCSPRYILLRKCFFILIVMFFSMMTSFTSFRADEGKDYSQVGKYGIRTGFKKNRIGVRLSNVVQ